MESLEFNSETDGFDLPREKSAVQEVPEEKVEEVTDILDEEVTELTEEERSLFNNLLTIGKTSKTFDVFGHEVILETMNVREELTVGMHIKKYHGSEAFARAYQAAVLAATVCSIDGDPLYVPLSASESESYIFEKKFNKVLEFYPIIVSEIYSKYIEVEKEFAGLAEKLGKLGG